ncbi:hypothetical protein BS333_03985 [Vibrio azureus]|uniref:Uncharacterized protein TP-0789 domain-containing protein n=1 Tax=Vibrio azureus NBRC 104587 TaxID=1219077 RepID=U3CGJ2_9VIBR|nr:outer membrane lipoprotein-sorting protein [Vibrio azureus]AUI85594.1 hypothetical protein BS333_03985 [Vibrio azureus]GAD77398.1 hypothetical protein VAZ01S_073_00310 [Vibrio azureus NBRC 104587]
MNHNRCVIAFLTLVGWLALPLMSLAAPSALDIVSQAEANRDGFNDMRASVSMVLRNGAGDESNRLMRIDTIEQENDGDKVLITFLAPGDIKGTSLLNFTHKVDDDERWLYLPVLKRTKRIASKNKSGPFMGSEFSYEDLSSPEIEKYDYVFLREEMINGHDSFVIERLPKDPHTGYTRQEVWYDKAALRILQVRFYDRKNTLLKTQSNTGFELYKQEFWYPSKVAMINHQTKQETELHYQDIRVDQGLDVVNFHPTRLKRVR